MFTAPGGVGVFPRARMAMPRAGGSRPSPAHKVAGTSAQLPHAAAGQVACSHARVEFGRCTIGSAFAHSVGRIRAVDCLFRRRRRREFGPGARISGARVRRSRWQLAGRVFGLLRSSGPLGMAANGPNLYVDYERRSIRAGAGMGLNIGPDSADCRHRWLHPCGSQIVCPCIRPYVPLRLAPLPSQFRRWRIG